MIVTDKEILCTHDEAEQLEAICARFEELANMSMVQAAEACDKLANSIMELRSIFEIEDEPTEYKPLPATFRCRICGRKYSFKSEAKGCEREHRRFMRR